jgi:hypothetical protein
MEKDAEAPNLPKKFKIGGKFKRLFFEKVVPTKAKVVLVVPSSMKAAGMAAAPVRNNALTKMGFLPQ